MTETRLGNYSSCCRLCLTDKFNCLNNIYAGYTDSDGLVEKIQLLVGVQINSNDKLSTFLCDKCFLTINNWDGYKTECVTNQSKLQKWMETWNDTQNTSIQIKDEPTDIEEDNNAIISLDDNEVEPDIKPEPVDNDDDMDLEYFDDPPSLTPHTTLNVGPEELENGEENGIDHISNLPEVSLTISNAPSKVIARANAAGACSPRSCSLCDKSFSSVGNRRKHERVMHGTRDGIAHNPNELLLSSSIPIVNGNNTLETGSQNGSESELVVLQKEPPTEKEQEKLDFAGALCLQSKSTAPRQSSLTKIEHSYLEKCRIMISMFDKVNCACHNQHFDVFKKMMGHLRQLYAWFPPYTCYNCLVTFDGRSGKMRHTPRCPRIDFEQLVRLSEMRARTDDKMRLYQNFKCMQCDYLYSFYEDFIDHVDSEHVPDEGPYTCICMQNFENPDIYRQHIHKSCYLNYYCDICFQVTPTIDEFVAHCEEAHDLEEGFQFLSVAPNFRVYSNIEIADMLLKSKEKQDAIENAAEMEAEASTEEPATLDDGEIINPRRRLNPGRMSHGFSSKYIATPCTMCGKVYSSFHNMLRHMKQAHGVDNVPKNTSNECDICGNQFSNYPNMIRHRRLHEHDERAQGSNYRCDECGQSFKNVILLEDHLEAEHARYCCQECRKEFDSLEELENHRSVHLNITLKKEPNTENYHSMASPSKMCQICDKTFESDDELESHMELHEKMPTLLMENEAEDDDNKSRKYECPECNKIYSSSRGLWVHNKRYHPQRQSNKDFPKECNLCDRTITTLAAWIMHRQMHERTSQKMYQVQKNLPPGSAGLSTTKADDSDYHTCKRCFKVFGSKYNLKTHMKCHGIHASPSRSYLKTGKFVKTFWCDICHHACHGMADLNKHKMEHLNEDQPELENEEEEVDVKPRTQFKQVYCKYCKIPFISVESLNKHMEEQHDEGGNSNKNKKLVGRYSCDICRKVFNTSGALSTHYGWHKRTKVEKAMSMQQKLIKKEMSSTPPPFFKCISCADTFENDTELQLHILEVHRNVNATVRMHKCPVCNLEFKSRSECETHEKLHYRQPHNKPGVQCRHCKKIFSRSDYLNIHISKKHPEHAAIGTYKCPQCDRMFEKQNALTIHLKVHERVNTSPPAPSGGQKVFKYSCSICHIGFDIPKELRNHIIAKHPF